MSRILGLNSHARNLQVVTSDLFAHLHVICRSHICVLWRRKKFESSKISNGILRVMGVFLKHDKEQVSHSFSEITTNTSFTDHLLLSLLPGGLITAFSAFPKR